MSFFQKISLRFRKHRAAAFRKDLLSDVRGFLRQEDDVLDPGRKDALSLLAGEIWMFEPGSDPDSDRKKLKDLAEKFNAAAGRNTFRNNIRNILDVLLVALSVAFGIRALFLQPFQIPTGSMQPTLFGIHYIDRAGSQPFTSDIVAFFRNIFAEKVKITADAAPIPQDPAHGNIYRYLDADPSGITLPPGTVICDGFLSTGDHLIVDRVSLHFSPLKRGEVFIFNTEGISDPFTGAALPGFFYIKRLAGLPGDTLKIENGVLLIRPQGENRFRPASTLSEKFQKIRSGKGGYHGHIADGLLAGGFEFTVPDNMYFALGDNSRNSFDSRYWGPLPRRNVIGRPLCIFWPASRRWGLVDKLDPLDTPSGIPNPYRKDSQMPAMRLQ